MNRRAFNAIVFDFGGVLLPLNDVAATFGADLATADFPRRWLRSPAVRAHETGRIDAAEFGRRAVAEFRLSMSPGEFIERFDRWPGRISDTTAAVVKRIPAHYDCAILSNTNARHWRAFDIGRDFGGRIGHVFLSFESGLVKPDGGAFRQLAAHYGCAASAILFIDDNPLNVAAARMAGLAARHCREPGALPALLRREGIVVP